MSDKMNKIKEKVLNKMEEELGHNTYVESDCELSIDKTLAEVEKVIDELVNAKNEEMKKAGIELKCICGKCNLPIWIDAKEFKQKLSEVK